MTFDRTLEPETTPQSSEAWRAVDYVYDFDYLDPKSVVVPGGASCSLALPDGLLFALPPLLKAERTESWEISTSDDDGKPKSRRQALAERLGLLQQVPTDEVVVRITKDGKDHQITLGPPEGSEDKRVAISFASECCFAAASRTAETDVNDFGPMLRTSRVIKAKSLAATITTDRPKCPPGFRIK